MPEDKIKTSTVVLEVLVAMTRSLSLTQTAVIELAGTIGSEHRAKLESISKMNSSIDVVLNILTRLVNEEKEARES